MRSTYMCASQLHKNNFVFCCFVFTFNDQYHPVIGFYGANEMEMTLIDEIIETAVDVFAAAQKVNQAQPQDRVGQHKKCYRSHDTVWQRSQVNQTRGTEI